MIEVLRGKVMRGALQDRKSANIAQGSDVDIVLLQLILEGAHADAQDCSGFAAVGGDSL